MGRDKKRNTMGKGSGKKGELAGNKEEEKV
jgi:hypothetical protein